MMITTTPVIPAIMIIKMVFSPSVAVVVVVVVEVVVVVVVVVVVDVANSVTVR